MEAKDELEPLISNRSTPQHNLLMNCGADITREHVKQQGIRSVSEICKTGTKIESQWAFEAKHGLNPK
jgi:hypothetical protein